MSNAYKLTISILITSVLFGLLGEMLFGNGDFGLNITLYFLTILASIAGLRFAFKNPLPQYQKTLLAFSAVFACSFAIYRSDEVMLFNCIGLFIAATLGLCITTNTQGKHTLSVRAIDTIKYGVGTFFMPILAVMRVASLLTNKPTDGSTDTYQHKLFKSLPIGGVLQGLLIALPLLALFGSLLTSADARFDQWLSQLLNFDIPSISEYVMQVIIFSVISLVVLYSALLRESQTVNHHNDSMNKPRYNIQTQTLTVLTCINALFFAYIIVQLGYFFGGKELVQQSEDVSYSLYARDGFWQYYERNSYQIQMLLMSALGCGFKGSPQHTR